jgi:hypothetical protein
LNSAQGFGVQIAPRGISPEPEPGQLVAAEKRLSLDDHLIGKERGRLIQDHHLHLVRAEDPVNPA